MRTESLTAPSHAPGNGFWIARDRRPRTASEAVLLPCRDCKPALRPAKPQVFVKPREISVSVGLRGGAGRTRTCNQPVMTGMLQSQRWPFPDPARGNATKMIAERTGILPRME